MVPRVAWRWCKIRPTANDILFDLEAIQLLSQFWFRLSLFHLSNFLLGKGHISSGSLLKVHTCLIPVRLQGWRLGFSSDGFPDLVQGAFDNALSGLCTSIPQIIFDSLFLQSHHAARFLILLIVAGGYSTMMSLGRHGLRSHFQTVNQKNWFVWM